MSEHQILTAACQQCGEVYAAYVLRPDATDDDVQSYGEFIVESLKRGDTLGIQKGRVGLRLCECKVPS